MVKIEGIYTKTKGKYVSLPFLSVVSGNDKYLFTTNHNIFSISVFCSTENELQNRKLRQICFIHDF